MDTVLLAGVAAAALAATWFFCLRPMWQGRCSMGGGAGQEDAELQRQIAELSEEIRMLRAQDALAEDRPVKRDGDG
ncbi:MAG: hypothetical protein GEU83_10970 [Pseudonocardiaceae bacterium]|nr:hypothetical protein [Pseudonocardiaceae bacterium]